MQIGRTRGIRQLRAIFDDGIGRFAEEKWRLALGAAHFLGVRRIVAAHTIDAVDRKAFGAAHDGHAGILYSEE